ncbi:hypothetical protein [Pelagibius sp. Alg239-R121]|uniref:hypothetical protein n=1 Tax=Pelagibius sp. Alg239-R121 TaxID=2993448 RepID=UPI0024A7079A|nr:hypothetical protein [Pelagibius sp. Alg239-R121]
MNAPVGEGSIFDLVGLVVFIALPTIAIALERGQKFTTRGKFALWTVGFCVLLFLILAYVGGAYGEFGLPPEVSVLPPLLAAYALVFFYFQRIARRSIDAGLRKIVAYCALIPVVNLLFVIALLILPTKRRTGNGQASGGNSSSEWYDSKGQQLYSCFCKAADGESGEPKISWSWILARRAFFRIFDDKVQCGNWIFPFSEVTKATVYKTKQWPFTHNILQLETPERCVQFGFLIWANPTKHLKLNIETKNTTLKTHPIAIVLRVTVLGYLAFEIWKAAS